MALAVSTPSATWAMEPRIFLIFWPRPSFSPTVRLRLLGLKQVVTKSPSPVSPAKVLGLAPIAWPNRVISARPRVTMADLVLLPKPSPSHNPHARAMTFLMLPPNSTPTISVLGVNTECIRIDNFLNFFCDCWTFGCDSGC